MSDRGGNDLRVRIDATSGDVAALAGYAPFASGRIANSSDVALVPGVQIVDSELVVHPSECVRVPGPLDPSLGILAPALASALSLWETLRLELGDAAAWTTGGPLSGLVGQVALWRGACPGIELGAATDARELDERQTERVNWSDQDIATARLAELAARRPGFAAVDLSGRADVIDIFLEVIPRWGRLLLAGPAGAPVTIDFYKNIHRKGIVIAATTIEPAAIFTSSQDNAVLKQMGRAAAILRNPKMAARCRQLLGAMSSARQFSVAS